LYAQFPAGCREEGFLLPVLGLNREIFHDAKPFLNLATWLESNRATDKP
jgi:hypothetical protein